jgi:hypothetical protein
MTSYNELTEGKKIALWAAVSFPIVQLLLEKEFTKNGISFKQIGDRWDTIYLLSKENREAEFRLENLLLEIVTIDRDSRPFKLDTTIVDDRSKHLEKVYDVVQSKLNILLPILDGMSKEEIIEHAQSLQPGKYERIRIVEVDVQTLKEERDKKV